VNLCADSKYLKQKIPEGCYATLKSNVIAIWTKHPRPHIPSY